MDLTEKIKQLGPEKVHFGLGGVGLALVSLMLGTWIHSADARMQEAQLAKEAGKAPEVAVAASSDQDYCTSELKPILRRVLTSCGLLKGGTARGCQPLEAKSVAAMSGGDFNALFLPLAERASILQFEKDEADLSESAQQLLDKTFADQRGASYFFVVSRASPEGSIAHNQELSMRRAEAVLGHLKENYKDPDLEQEVGLLWLGEEFAQLDQEFCGWQRSKGEGPCNAEELNRSAFIAWIDCRL